MHILSKTPCLSSPLLSVMSGEWDVRGLRSPLTGCINRTLARLDTCSFSPSGREYASATTLLYACISSLILSSSVICWQLSIKHPLQRIELQLRSVKSSIILSKQFYFTGSKGCMRASPFYEVPALCLCVWRRTRIPKTPSRQGLCILWPQLNLHLFLV